MNKIISFVLLGALLLMCFSGCETPNVDEPVKKYVELARDNVLVSVLADHLETINADTYFITYTHERKIDFIKNGIQAVRADFNSSSRYFVCAYYVCEHDDEATNYCCAYKYTWVKFENAGDVCEKYKDLDFIAAFQIDSSASVTDLISEDAKAPNVEHFTMYSPTFTNGINTADALSFNKSSILLNYNDSETLYYTTTSEVYQMSTLDCVNVDGRCYLTVYLYTIGTDNSYNEADTSGSLGKYHDTLMSMMSDAVYGEIDSRGRTNCYGLIELGNFVNYISWR